MTSQPTVRSISLAIALTCSLLAPSSPRAENGEPGEVSLVQLIANPADFAGKRVRVFGFCRLEFEGTALYLHRDDAEWGIAKNGFWLGVGWPVPESFRPLGDEYVLVEGVVDPQRKGHMGSWSGSLIEITRMQRVASRTELDRWHRLNPPVGER